MVDDVEPGRRQPSDEMLLELVSGVVGPERNDGHRREPTRRLADFLAHDPALIGASRGEELVGERCLGGDHHAGVGLECHALLTERGRRLCHERRRSGGTPTSNAVDGSYPANAAFQACASAATSASDAPLALSAAAASALRRLEGAEVGVGHHFALALQLRRPGRGHVVRLLRRSTRSSSRPRPEPGRPPPCLHEQLPRTAATGSTPSRTRPRCRPCLR